MTYRRGINSKHASKDFLKRGLKSMFPGYGEEKEANQPKDAESAAGKRPPSK